MESVENIDQYIAQFDDTVQGLLITMRATISNVIPEAEECINYGMPTFKLNGNLVHFAGYKNHIGFYPTPSAISAFATEISEYKWAKGSVQFPIDEPLPLDLIRRMVEFRVQENLAKPKAKTKSKK
uniref:iron chaperone n=1 Tax=Roseivirga sp. TaxID=1964215 RepID=UPI0040484D5A